LADSNYYVGVLLATLSLVEEILDIRPDYKEKFKKYVPLLVSRK